MLIFLKKFKRHKRLLKEFLGKKTYKKEIFSRDKITVNLSLTIDCNLHTPRESAENSSGFSRKNHSFSDSFRAKKTPQQTEFVAAYPHISGEKLFFQENEKISLDLPILLPNTVHKCRKETIKEWKMR